MIRRLLAALLFLTGLTHAAGAGDVDWWSYLGIGMGGAVVQYQTAAPSPPGAKGTAQPVDATHGLPVASAPVAVTPTDRGGTIATGGTAQNAMAANASRKGGWIQNPCNANEDLFVSTSTSAVTTPGAPDDADLAPCQSFSLNQAGLIVQSAVSVNAATTGHAYIGKETQ